MSELYVPRIVDGLHVAVHGVGGAGLVGGTGLVGLIHLDSRPGAGTSLEAEFPLPPRMTAEAGRHRRD
ncbi:MAG: hypothetical protein ABSB59_06535 [Streptosporangiaceae bacterium]|jgi:hypothetical protein